MLEMLAIYQWTIVAGVFAAIALALLGCQIAARDKAMQTLCIGQGAMLGVLVGVGIVGQDLINPGMNEVAHGEVSEFSLHALPFFLAVMASLAVGALGVRLDRKERAAKNTYFIALFALLLSLNYLATALFPGLESHMTQVFFGDLATLSKADVWLTLGLSIGMAVAALVHTKALTRRSFEEAILGGQPLGSPVRLLIIEGLSFLFVCFSIQFLGFLFTISTLFIPTICVSLSQRNGLFQHLALVTTLAGLGVFVGFVTSLGLTMLPTVPTIAFCLCTLGFLMSVLRRARI